MTAAPAARGPRLLLLGVSVRAMAASALAGPRTRARFPGGIVAVDYFGDADLRLRRGGPPHEILSLRRDFGSRRDVAALARAALSLRWDAWAYAGGLENRPATIARLAGAGTLLGNDAATVRAVRDPGRLFAVLRDAGLPHPRTVSPAPGRAPRRGDWVWKRRRSGAGLGVCPAPPGSRGAPGAYLQEFVAGVPASVVFLADGVDARLIGGSLMLVGCRELGARGFLYGGSIAGPVDDWLPPAARGQLAAAAAMLTRRFGLVGINGIDFVLRDDIPLILEVNPRFTASAELLEEQSGRNLFDLHLGACAGVLPAAGAAVPVRGGEGRPRAIQAGRRPPRFLGKGILYAGRPVRAGDPRRLAAIGCRDLPEAGEVIEAGEPVCTVIATGATPADCRRRILRQAGRARAALPAACGTISSHHESSQRPPAGVRPPVARGAQHGDRADRPAGPAGAGRRLPGPGPGAGAPVAAQR